MFKSNNRNNKALSNIYSTPKFKEYQTAFEKRLGIYAYNHTLSYKGVNTAIDKMKSVLYSYYKDSIYSPMRDEAEKKKRIFLEAFTNENSSMAGQIGRDSYSNIEKIIDNTMPEKISESQLSSQVGLDGAGNLREKMAAFYNAAYFNNTFSFKNIMQDIMSATYDRSVQLIDTLNLSSSVLLTKNRAQSVGFLKKLFYNGKKNTDVYSDNFLAANSKDKEDNYFLNRFRYKNLQEKDYTYKDINYADEMGLPMSAREKRHQDQYKKMLLFMHGPNFKKSGILNNKKVFNSKGFMGWLGGGNSLVNKRGFSMIAGTSSTAAKLLNTCKWLGLNNDDLLNFRLALIGWLVPEGNNSLYEVLKGGHMVGVRGDEDMTDAASMDKLISPLSKEEIVDTCGITMQFYADDTPSDNIPDKKILPIDAWFLDRFSYLGSGMADYRNKSFFSLPRNEYISTLRLGATPALVAYMNYLHEHINTYISFKHYAGSALGKSLYKKIKNNKIRDDLAILSNEEYNKSDAYYKVNENDLSPNWMNNFTDDMDICIAFINRYLKERPKYNEIVYRGDWMSKTFTKYREGHIVNHPSFTSTSQSIDTATEFASMNGYKHEKDGNPALLVMKLNKHSGTDISDINTKEHEVLLMPGSRFKVVSAISPSESCNPIDEYKKWPEEIRLKFNQDNFNDLLKEKFNILYLEELPNLNVKSTLPTKTKFLRSLLSDIPNTTDPRKIIQE